jgi:hypothetical protein
MVANADTSLKATPGKHAPFYGDKSDHYVLCEEHQIDEVKCHAIL